MFCECHGGGPGRGLSTRLSRSLMRGGGEEGPCSVLPLLALGLSELHFLMVGVLH